MPELLDLYHDRELTPGDVLLVERKMKDRQSRKPFVWRFFMIVTRHDVISDQVHGWVVGAAGKLKDMPFTIYIDQEKNTVHYLPPDEWPDGVHAFRTALIMQRKIEV